MTAKTPKESLPERKPSRPDAVARKILKRLQAGAYSGGKLPSQRVLAAELGVSRNTVQLALETIREGGWINTAERRRASIVAADTPLAQKIGAFLTASSFSAPPVNASFKRQDERAAAAENCINLSVLCDEHWDEHINFDVENDALKSALEKYRRGETQIYRATGIAKLKALVCRHLARIGVQAAPSEIAVIPRRLQAYRQVADILLGSRSELWAPELSLARFYGVAERLDAHRRFLPMTAEGEIDFSPLYFSKRPRLALLEPDRQKPTGANICAEDRARLVREARRQNIFLFEDCYCSMLYEDRIEPLAAYDPEKQSVIHLGALPTWLSPLGGFSYIVANERLIELFRASVRRDYLNPEFLAQLCAVELLESGAIDEMLERFHAFHRNRILVLDRLLAERFGHCARWRLPGSFGCIWLELPDINISRLYRERRDIDFQPGWLYGESEKLCRHLLLRYTMPLERLAEGLSRLSALLPQLH